MKEEYEVVVLANEVLCKNVWSSFKAEIESRGFLGEVYKVRGRRVKAQNIAAYFEKRTELDSFEIEDDNVYVHFGYNGSSGVYLFHVELRNENYSCDWVGAVRDLGEFVSCRLYDIDYERWQNSIDLGRLMAGDKPYEHFRVIDKNGLKLVDYSWNKGRVHTQNRYIEAVGSTMWLGDKFFELTGASKEAVRAADWLEVSEESPGILKVVAQEKPFTTDQGEEGELQDKMRDLLFPRHKELDAKRRGLEG